MGDLKAFIELQPLGLFSSENTQDNVAVGNGK